MEDKKTNHVVIVKSLVINERGEVLFVKRNFEERPDLHGKWEFPGGKVDFGEQPEHTAIREAKEETGYHVEVRKLLPKLMNFSKNMDGTNHTLTLICYLCELIGGSESLTDDGVSEIKWFDIENVPQEQECLPGTIDFLTIYRGIGKR
jgi:mutator protein MutT